MSTTNNFFRPNRHFRSVFREGKYLLNTEATEIQLEVLDRLREQIREAYGPSVSIKDGLLVEADTVVGRVIIRPGSSYVDGYPISLASSEDPLYSLGTSPTEFTSADFIKVGKSSGETGGIALNLGGATPVPSGIYQVVTEIKEELITASQDPYLRSANLSESTADRHRIIVDIHLIPKYIGLNPINGTTLDTAPIPYRGGADNNFVDFIEVTPSGSTYVLVSTLPITGAEAIDGRNLEIQLNNGNGSTTAALPLSNADIREFIHGKLVDSNGTEFHISNMFVTPGDATRMTIQLDLEKTRPVQLTTFQSEPVITDGISYKLVKRDLFVTSAGSLPEGKRYYPVSEIDWNGATVTNSDITDLRPKILAKDGVLDLIRNQGLTLNTLGNLGWDTASAILSWSSPLRIDTVFEGFDWTIAASDTDTLFSGFSTNEVLYVDLKESPLGGSLTLQKGIRGVGDLDPEALSATNVYWIAKRLTDGTLQLNDGLLINSNANQNKTVKLISGGTWSWNSVSNELVNSLDAYLQMAGISNISNTVLAQTITLATDGDCAYISIKRSNGTSNRTVIVASIASIPQGDDTFILARRVGNDVLVGTNSFLLKDGEFLELDGALAEINRYHGQLKVAPANPISTRVIISSSDILKLSGATLSLEQRNLILSFEGAQIDFETGEVFESDGVTPLLGGANDFTPFSVTDGSYFWYSITLVPESTNADNTISGQMLVLKALAEDAVLVDAPKAPFPSQGIKLANVLVQGTATGIENIDYSNIKEMNTSGGSGSGNSLVKADYHDPVSTVLPTGASVIIDGVAGVNGDLVLFSNLLSGDNKIYELDGVGAAISWTPTLDFNLGTPEDGDAVVILAGDSFRESIGLFDGTEWKFNDTVRYFSGSDYWEQSSLKTSAIAASTTGDIFTVELSGSENMIIDYSMFIGAAKETGQVILTSDGTLVEISQNSADITAVDVDLFADIVTTTLRFRYTNNTGDTGDIKYSVKRWSNSSGGPGGITSYSGASGAGVTAAGPIAAIQYKGGDGNLAGETDLSWDTGNKQLLLGTLKVDKLQGPLTINDNQIAATTIVSYAAASNKYAVFEYSIERNGQNRVGRLLVVNNGSVAFVTDDSVDTGGLGIDDTEIVFSVAISGGNVLIQYISSSTGFTGELKYSSRRWA